MKNIENVISFINNNFKEGNILTHTRNLSDLMKYLKSESISIESINFEDYSKIFNNCPVINDMVGVILGDNSRDSYLNNEFFNTLAILYCDINGIDFTKFDTNDNNYADTFVHSNDIDLMKVYLNDIGSYKLLNKEEIANLFKQYKDGNEEAKNIIASHNLRLVVSIAKKYNGKGIELPDLIQEGSLGLMKAIEKYKPNLGYQFSTYATWWIRQSITRAIANDSRTIRIPVHSHELLNKIRRYQSEYSQMHHCFPSVEELCKEFNVTERTLRDLLSSQDLVSLNTYTNDEEGKQDTELGEFLIDPRFSMEEAERNMYAREIHDLIDNSSLKDREKDVVYKRFGLKTGETMTLEEISNDFNLTRERIRQIEKLALRKLKVVLKDYDPYDFVSNESNTPYFQKGLKK